MSWIGDHDGIERVCGGAYLHIEGLSHPLPPCKETPRQVHLLCETSETDMLELHYERDPEVTMYADRRHITAMVPFWVRVEG